MEISKHLPIVSFSRESVKSPPALNGSNWFPFSGSRPTPGLPRSALPGHVRLGLARDSRAGGGAPAGSLCGDQASLAPASEKELVRKTRGPPEDGPTSLESRGFACHGLSFRLEVFLRCLGIQAGNSHLASVPGHSCLLVGIRGASVGRSWSVSLFP